MRTLSAALTCSASHRIGPSFAIFPCCHMSTETLQPPFDCRNSAKATTPCWKAGFWAGYTIKTGMGTIGDVDNSVKPNDLERFSLNLWSGKREKKSKFKSDQRLCSVCCRETVFTFWIAWPTDGAIMYKMALSAYKWFLQFAFFSPSSLINIVNRRNPKLIPGAQLCIQSLTLTVSHHPQQPVFETITRLFWSSPNFFRNSKRIWRSTVWKTFDKSIKSAKKYWYRWLLTWLFISFTNTFARHKSF